MPKEIKNSEYLSKVESKIAPNRLFLFVLAATCPSSTSKNPHRIIATPAHRGCAAANRIPATKPNMRAMKLIMLGVNLRVMKRLDMLSALLSAKVLSCFGRMRVV